MRIIFSDLDGTLLGRGQTQLNKNAKKAIYSVLESGNLFAIASGRTYIELKEILKEFEDDIYFITNDGSLAVYKEQTLFDMPMEPDMFKDFKSYTAHGKYITYIKTDSSLLVRKTMEQYRNHVMKIDSTDDIKESIYKISDFDKTVPCPLEIVYRNHDMNEYIAQGADKAIAVKHILNLTGIKKEDAYAFGDNINDIAMFKECKTSYAVASAPPNIKKCADKVTYNIEEEITNIAYRRNKI
jgi:Cof subfamily protein (haloacid dehalogenase superfamily)